MLKKVFLTTNIGVTGANEMTDNYNAQQNIREFVLFLYVKRMTIMYLKKWTTFLNKIM